MSITCPLCGKDAELHAGTWVQYKQYMDAILDSEDMEAAVLAAHMSFACKVAVSRLYYDKTAPCAFRCDCQRIMPLDTRTQVISLARHLLNVRDMSLEEHIIYSALTDT
jgi:hypothetical protein